MPEVGSVAAEVDTIVDDGGLAVLDAVKFKAGAVWDKFVRAPEDEGILAVCDGFNLARHRDGSSAGDRRSHNDRFSRTDSLCLSCRAERYRTKLSLARNDTRAGERRRCWMIFETRLSCCQG